MENIKCPICNGFLDILKEPFAGYAELICRNFKDHIFKAAYAPDYFKEKDNYM